MADHTRSYPDGDKARNSRSQSPHRHHHRSHRNRSPRRHHNKRRHTPEPAPKELPYNSRPLTKRDYAVFMPMFALYLDIQKGKVLDDLDEVEVKGRWKSFVGKWNRGELAEGWYDPSTLHKAQQSADSSYDDYASNTRPKATTATTSTPGNVTTQDIREYDSDSDDSVGPSLPGQDDRSRKKRTGPSIPNMQDLELKRELEAEDSLARRDDVRYDRKMDRKAQRAALDELVPKAEAGTRERQLEKKKEVNEKMKSFRERSPGAAEVPDTELMGGGDGVGEFKKMKEEVERKKNERELRKEEILRARMAERDERLSEYRAKEEGTMAMLKALAKQRFG